MPRARGFVIPSIARPALAWVMEPSGRAVTPAGRYGSAGREVGMATARIIYTWPDGSCVDLEVDSGDDTAHPDLLDELVRRVIVLYRETCVAGE